MLVLTTFVNPLAALLAVGGNFFYVIIYTLWLKRTTPQNIVIGGAAGSFPPLVGWAAVTGSLGVAPLLIAAIIFYWTPPHFWSLALLKANDYRRAGDSRCCRSAMGSRTHAARSCSTHCC